MFQDHPIRFIKCVLILKLMLISGSLAVYNQSTSARFLGDTSLRSYLTNLCAGLNDRSKVRLVLVVDGNRSLSDSLLAGHLRQLACGHVHRHDSNRTLSDPVPWSNSYYDWLLLFEWSHLTRWTLTEPMLTTSHIYAQCVQCLPPIGLLDPAHWSTDQLTHWLRHTILPRVSPKFRAVLATGLDRANAALHIRPILDGCHTFY